MEPKAEALAEEAIRAVGRRDVPTAQMTVTQAYQMDRALGPLVDVVHLACAEIEAAGEVSDPTWNGLADAVPSGSLRSVVESSRG